MTSIIYQIRVCLTEGPREMRYSAVFDDAYDGAPDSSNRGNIGWGETPALAVLDLMENYQP